MTMKEGRIVVMTLSFWQLFLLRFPFALFMLAIIFVGISSFLAMDLTMGDRSKPVQLRNKVLFIFSSLVLVVLLYGITCTDVSRSDVARFRVDTVKHVEHAKGSSNYLLTLSDNKQVLVDQDDVELSTGHHNVAKYKHYVKRNDVSQYDFNRFIKIKTLKTSDFHLQLTPKAAKQLSENGNLVLN